MNIVRRHRRFLGLALAVLVLAAGATAGWLLRGGGEPAEAAVPVEFLPAAAIQANAFTPPADIRGTVTIKGSGPFGGSGSDLVCDRELLIRALVARPDRLRAWARVAAIAPNASAVARYIRSLRPSTLTAPTRVTNHSFVDGQAVGFQAILAAGTAVLVDAQGAIRARCRCGNPLLDPVPATTETCRACPAGYTPPRSWRLSSLYYVEHPAPPPAKGEKRASNAYDTGQRITVRLLRTRPAEYVLEATEIGRDGKPRSRTINVPKPKVKIRTRVVVKTRTVTVPGPTRTIVVPRIVTVYKPVPVIRYRTKIIYEGAG